MSQDDLTSKTQFLSSAIHTLIYSLHTRFCTSLEMKTLKQQLEERHLRGELIASETEIERKTAKLEDLGFELELERSKAATDAELRRIRTEADIIKASKSAEDAKRELILVQDPEFHERTRIKNFLTLDESIARLRVFIHKHEVATRDPSCRTEQPSPEEIAQNKREAGADKIHKRDAWTRKELLKLDEQLRQELAEVDAAPWTEKEKKDKIYEIKARIANCKEEILNIIADGEDLHG